MEWVFSPRCSCMIPGTAAIELSQALPSGDLGRIKLCWCNLHGMEHDVLILIFREDFAVYAISPNEQIT